MKSKMGNLYTLDEQKSLKWYNVYYILVYQTKIMNEILFYVHLQQNIFPCCAANILEPSDMIKHVMMLVTLN